MADKPKRPLSAYMLWLNSARESIKRENPGIKVTEVAKRGGELWRAMKDKSVSTTKKRERRKHFPYLLYSLTNAQFFIVVQEWEAKAAKAKDDYDRAVKDFEANGGSSASNGSAKKRSKPAKKPAKKSKKEDSDDDDDDESEQT